MADSFFDQVVLLCRFDSAVVDESNSAHTLAVVGSPSISATQSVAGGSSLLNSTSATNRGNFVHTATHTDFEWDGDFTIELWAYAVAHSATYNAVLSTYRTDGLVGGFQFGRHSSGTVFAYVNQTAYSPGTNSAGSFPLNTWTHLCLERAGTTVRVYVNGTPTATLASAVSTTIGGGRIEIGAGDTASTGSSTGSSSNRDFQGFIDELRITKGVARYAGSSFTPPSGDDFLEDTGGPPTMGEARTTALYREALTADRNVATTAAYRETVLQGSNVATTASFRETLLSRAEPATTAAYRETLYSRAEPASTAVYREVLRSTRVARTGLRKRSASLSWDTLIELVEIDLSPLKVAYPQVEFWQQNDDAEPGVIRLSPNWAQDELDALQGKPISFREKLWWPSAIQADGFAWSIKEQLPRPTLTMADLTGTLLAMTTDIDDMIGAVVSYYMTDIAFLDFVPGTNEPTTPGGGDAYGPEVFLINRLAKADGFELSYELIAEIDQPSAMIPGRLLFRRDFPGLGRQSG